MLIKEISREQKYALFVSIPLVGHLSPLVHQANALQARGWKVAIASTSEISWYVHEYCPDADWIELAPQPKELADLFASGSAEDDFKKSISSILTWLYEIWPFMFDDLLKKLDTKPDLFIVDISTFAGIYLAEYLQIPCIINNPLILTNLPSHILPSSNEIPLPFDKTSIYQMGKWHHLRYPLLRMLRNVGLHLAFQKKLNERRRLRHLPDSNRSDLKAVLYLINTAFGLEYERPLPPAIKMVGPMIPKTFAPLPDEVREWLDKDIPTVFLSFGTLVPYTKELIAKLIQALNSDRFQLLWLLNRKFRHLLPEHLPSNFRIETWVPSTLSVFCHTKVQAFISHCGINSVQESLYFGTPVVGIPFFADQEDMGYRLKDSGAGVLLDKISFTPDELKEAVHTVMNSEKVLKAKEKIRASLHLAGGIDHACDLIENVAYFGSVINRYKVGR